MYQEGIQNTRFLIYDLTPNAVRDEDRLELLLGERDITHVALLRPEPMQSPKAADFSWTHQGGFWFGASRQATRAKPTPRSVRIDSIDSNGSNEARANPPRSTTMKPSQIESITKAAQCAQLLVSDIAGAQRLACEGQPALAILLLDLIADAKKLNDRLAQIEAALVRKDPDPASASGE